MNKIFTNNTPQILSSKFDFIDNVNDKDIVLALQYENNFNYDEISTLKTFGIKTIGNVRFNKIEQNIILNRFNIPTPQIFYNVKKNIPFKNIEEFDSYCDLNEFIVKPWLGARGLGVKKLNRKKYKLLLDDPNKNTPENNIIEEKENTIIN